MCFYCLNMDLPRCSVNCMLLAFQFIKLFKWLSGAFLSVTFLQVQEKHVTYFTHHISILEQNCQNQQINLCKPIRIHYHFNKNKLFILKDSCYHLGQGTQFSKAKFSIIRVLTYMYISKIENGKKQFFKLYKCGKYRTLVGSLNSKLFWPTLPNRWLFLVLH